MKNKNKGFTLIELLVVISIISLLSSIVLASVKRVRENAQITKTVSEMKSLQTAIELYKNRFGVYPGGSDIPYTTNETLDASIELAGGYLNNSQPIQFLLTTFLSPFLPKTPTPPNNSDYSVGYVKYTSSNNYYFACNKQKINNYLIYFYTGTKKVNLPLLEYVEGSNVTNPFGGGVFNETQPRIYCISM